MKDNIRQLVIVGGGVTGTALAKVIAQYTNISKITLIEKCAEVAMVNSNALNNAQTSHDGSTETNYSLEHALDIKFPADMLRNYAQSKHDPRLTQITNRMALAIGPKQVSRLTKRFEEFSPHYSDLTMVNADGLRKIEPKIMEGRKDKPGLPADAIAAMVSDKGFAINYKILSEYMMEDALSSGKDTEVLLNTEVGKVELKDGLYVLHTTQGIIKTRVVVFAAGSYSLKFAKELGYGDKYTIFPVAGSFVVSPRVVNGKVYPMQDGGNPWAKIHVDPDILDPTISRWGPTTKPLPLMERHHYKTAKDFIQMGMASWAGFRSTIKIIKDEHLLGYLLKNELYDMPVIGMRLFLREVQEIIPTMQLHDLSLRRGAGGIRPQLVDMEKGELVMGDSCIIGNNVIFNTTPSPGASICFGNAYRDAIQIVKFLGDRFSFDEERLLDDLKVKPRKIKFDVMHVG